MAVLSNCSPGMDAGLGIMTFCLIFNAMSTHKSKMNIIFYVGSMFLVNFGAMHLSCSIDGWQYIVKKSAFHCFFGICAAYLTVFVIEKLIVKTSKSD